MLRGLFSALFRAAKESTRLQLLQAGVVECPLEDSEMSMALSGLDCPGTRGLLNKHH